MPANTVTVTMHVYNVMCISQMVCTNIALDIASPGNLLWIVLARTL